MRALVGRELVDACRTQGLVVDDDFELGISPARRVLRTTLLAAVVVTLGVMTTLLITPDRAPSSPQQRSLRSPSHPVTARPFPVAPSRRGRANV